MKTKTITKDQLWDKHSQEIIDIASDYGLDEWNMIVGKKLGQPTMDSTGKHKGLTLLKMLTVSDMVQLLEDNKG
jgi:hypothetical protein